MTHAFENHEPVRYGFTKNCGFERLGAIYRWYSSDPTHQVLENQETKIKEYFTHADFRRMLEAEHAPLVYVRNKFGGSDPMTAQAVRDFSRKLSFKDELLTLTKKDYCDRFLKKEYDTRGLVNKRSAQKNARVTRSDVSMEATILEIEQDIRERNEAIKVAQGGIDKKKDYRRELREAKESLILNPSPRTLRRWLKAYETSGGDRMTLVSKNGSSRLGSFYKVEEALFLEMFVRKYASSDRPTMIDLHDLMTDEIDKTNREREELGLRPLRVPSLKTFRKRVNELPQAFKDRGRLGEEAATSIHRMVNGGLDEIIRPLERVEMDEWKIDLQTILVLMGVWEKLTEKQRRAIPRVRLWLTAAIDVATKCLVGFRVHREAPSVSTAIATVELTSFDKTEFAKTFGCITPWYMHGAIEAFVFDSAPWFTSQAFRVMIADLGSTIFFPPAGAASARGTIERFFRTASEKALVYLSGRTWGSHEEKGNVDAQALASVTFDMLAELFYRFFVDVYHNTPHDGLGGETPRDAWDRKTRIHRVSPPVFGDVRRHIFGVNVRRSISKSGITFMGAQYQSPALQQFRRGKHKPEALLRVARHDLGSISVWLDKGWITVPAVVDEFKGMSLYAWAIACNALRTRNAKAARLSRDAVRKTKEYARKSAEIARLEAGLASPCINEEDFNKWEKQVVVRVGYGDGDAIPEDFAKDLVVDPQFYLDMGLTISPEKAAYNVDPRDEADDREANEKTSAPEAARSVNRVRGTRASTKFDRK